MSRILTVDCHPVVRAGLNCILSREMDIQFWGETDSRKTAIEIVNSERPELVLLDLCGSGIELIEDIVRLFPAVSILVFSQLDELLFSERALRAGARGYIMKTAQPEEILLATRSVLRGEIYLSAPMRAKIVERATLHGGNAGITSADRLSDRELEVFELIGQGMSTRRIAEKLTLSVKTIETYRAHLKKKLGLLDGAELVQFAVKSLLI